MTAPDVTFTLSDHHNIAVTAVNVIHQGHVGRSLFGVVDGSMVVVHHKAERVMAHQLAARASRE